MLEHVREKLKDSIEIFISVFIILLFIVFELSCWLAPLLLAVVYSGWYLLLYFISIPLFFVAAYLIQ